MGAESHGGSLWQEDDLRDSCVDGSEVRAFWWRVSPRNRFRESCVGGIEVTVPWRTPSEHAVFFGHVT